MKRKRRIEITRYSRLTIIRGDDAADFGDAAPDVLSIDMFAGSPRGSQPVPAEIQQDSGASNPKRLRFPLFRRLIRLLPSIRWKRPPP
jgi:hypothetical protein